MKRTEIIISITVFMLLSCCCSFFFIRATLSPVIMANIMALADEKTLNEEDDGCNKNMASVCAEAGFYTVPCTANGQITIGEFTLKGEYRKGGSYYIPWARYECRASTGNKCCKQGLFTGDQQLA